MVRDAGDGEAPGATVEAFDDATFRQVLARFATGVVVVTGATPDGPAGLTCQSFSSLSLEPPLVLFCPGKTSSSWPRIRESGAFAINVLSAKQEDISRVFATKEPDKFRGIGWKPGSTGSPILTDVLAAIDCRVEAEHEAGDHTIVVGRVSELHITDDHPGPLLFYRGGYGRFEA